MALPPLAYILFDLDNTLYSASWGLEQAVTRRVNEYLARRMDLPLEEAWERRKEGVHRSNYGTTMEWLMAEEGMDGDEVERYFAFIHPEDEAAALPPDPALRSLLRSLAAEKRLPLGILTNSPLEHTLRVLGRLGIGDCFSSIFDIRRNGLKGKPHETVYRRALAELGLEPASCLFVDDIPRYIEGYRAIGGSGVYYDEMDRHPEFPGPRIRRLEELLGGFSRL